MKRTLDSLRVAALGVLLAAGMYACTDDPVSGTNGDWPADIPTVPDSLREASRRPDGTVAALYYVAGECVTDVSSVAGTPGPVSYGGPANTWNLQPVPHGETARLRIRGSKAGVGGITTFHDADVTLTADTVMIFRCP